MEKGLWQQLTKESMEKAVYDIYCSKPRQMGYTINTGTGGMQLLDIIVEEMNGFRRVYIKKFLV